MTAAAHRRAWGPSHGGLLASLEHVLDARGVPVTTTDPEAARALAEAVDGFVSHRAHVMARLRDALEIDPGLVVGHVLAGLGAWLLGRRDLHPIVLGAHEDASRSLAERGGTAREERLVIALRGLADGEPRRALDALEAVLSDQPLDVLALKAHHALCFYLGESRAMRVALERALPAWRRAEAPGLGAVLGCQAFALTETGELELARRTAHEADLASAARRELDPWGKHAAVHALHALGLADEALHRIATMTADLEGASNFAGHVHWHEAMLRSERGEHARALALHDQAIAIYPARDYRDVVNATTLLYGLEREGVDVGPRWAAPADAAEARVGDHGSPFADAHYVLALVGAGRGPALARFLASMDVSARSERGHAAELARSLGLEVAEAIASLSGTPGRTAETLERRRTELARLGGSRAQRRIFEWIRDDAERRARDRGSA